MNVNHRRGGRLSNGLNQVPLGAENDGHDEHQEENHGKRESSRETRHLVLAIVLFVVFSVLGGVIMTSETQFVQNSFPAVSSGAELGSPSIKQTVENKVPVKPYSELTHELPESEKINPPLTDAPESQRPSVQNTTHQPADQSVDTAEETYEDILPVPQKEEIVAVLHSDKPKVCVRAINPRIGSLFVLNYLEEFGSKYHYVLSKPLLRLIAPFVDSGAFPRETFDRFLEEPCQKEWPVLQIVLPATLQLPIRYPGMIILAGDEKCECVTCPTDDRISIRQYHSIKLDMPYLPLGPRFEFLPPRGPLKLPSEREYLFNFIGAPTSYSRRALVKMLRGPLGPTGGFVHMTPIWRKDPGSKGYIAPPEYRKVLLNSQFTLCPQGHNPEAFRIFEAVDSGSIPIIALDSEYNRHVCEDAFRPLIESGAPFVWLNSWRDLNGKLEELRQDPELVTQMQANMAKWRTEFWTATTEKLETLFQEYQDAHPRTTKVLPETSLKVAAKSNTLSPMKTIPLLTGCGRSGTLSLKEYLQKDVGISAVHEDLKVGAVSVSWLYAASQDTQYPFEKLNSVKQRQRLAASLGPDIFGPVVHLTRHPLKVMSSTRRCFCGRGDRSLPLGRQSDMKSWRFVETHIPRIDPDSSFEDLGRSALYWIEWNKLIDRRFPGNTHVRLEDAEPAALVGGLGITRFDTTLLPKTLPHTKGHVSPAKEKIRLPDVTWTELRDYDPELAREVLDLAQHYGYETGKELSELIDNETKY